MLLEPSFPNGRWLTAKKNGLDSTVYSNQAAEVLIVLPLSLKIPLSTAPIYLTHWNLVGFFPLFLIIFFNASLAYFRANLIESEAPTASSYFLFYPSLPLPSYLLTRIPACYLPYPTFTLPLFALPLPIPSHCPSSLPISPLPSPYLLPYPHLYPYRTPYPTFASLTHPQRCPLTIPLPLSPPFSISLPPLLLIPVHLHTPSRTLPYFLL